MSSRCRLLADIGGTHARFAWQEGAESPLEYVQVLNCADHAGWVEAALWWLQQHRLPRPRQAAIAVASAVDGDQVVLTNNPWSFSIQTSKARMQLEQLVVLNDFTALALGLPTLAHTHFWPLGPARQTPFASSAPVAVLGAGTGLGVSGLLPDKRGSWTAVQGEGGHSSLAIHDELEYRVWSALRQRFGHVSAERVLSGSGLVNIHSSLLSLADGCWPDQPWAPAQITDAALSRQEPVAVQTLQLFCSWLGAVPGDLALTLGARGGVFIGGGIAPRMASFLQQSGFRRAFESKGRFAPYLASVPVWVVDAPVSPALAGAASVLD